MAWTRLPSCVCPTDRRCRQVSRLSLSACVQYLQHCAARTHARLSWRSYCNSGAAELRVPCVSDTQKETAPEGAVSDLHSPP